MNEELYTYSVGSVSNDRANWVEGVIEDTQAPYIEMPGLIFYSGTHRGKRWAPEDLQEIADNFSAPDGDRDWSVPVQLDHSDSARDTVGNIRRVWTEKGQLWGTLRYVGADAVEKVKNGTWRKLSMGVYGKPKKRLREVSVTPFPVLAGASNYSESEDTMDNDDAKTDEPTNFAELKAQIESQFAERTKKLEERLEHSEKRNQELGKVVRFTQLTAEIDRYSETGKTLPVMREAELALVETFSDEQMDLFRKYKEVTPALVRTDVIGSQDPRDVEEFREGDDDADKAKDLAAKYR